MRLIDITGHRFGRLTVERKADTPSPSGGSLWICRCDCGAVSTKNASNLRNGATLSCGCAQSDWASSMGSNPEFIAKRAKRQTQHGHKRRGAVSAEYKTWLRIKRRCSDPADKDFPNWGGRGIKVCDRWQSEFSAFFADMGAQPDGHSIDRLDPNGNYEPTNCRWATASQQASENKRDIIPVSVHGIDYPSVSAACRAFGLKLTTVRNRMNTGMPINEAFDISDARKRSRRTRESYLRKDSR